MVKDMKVKFVQVFEKTKPQHSLYAWIMLVLLTLPHINPKYLNEFPIGDNLINCGRIISAVLILVWLLVIKRNFSLIALLISIQQGFLLCNTIVLGGAVRECAIQVFSVLSIVILYDLARDEKEVFLSSQLFCFEFVIYINLVTEILFPDTLYVPQVTAYSLDYHSSDYWFLGFRNVHSQYFIPALMIAFLYMLETGKKLRTLLLTVAIYVSAVLAWSGGVLIALTGMCIVYIFLKKWTKIFHYFNYWMMHIFFFIFIIVLKMQNLFKWLIDGVLGKWRSLGVRMTLWDRYLKEFIPNKLICGYGIELSVVRQMKVNINWAGTAHNQLLEILYQGGIINFILFTVIVIVAGKNIYQYRDTEESKIISIVFFGWCLHGLVEPFMTPFLMGMFVIAYHSNEENGAVVPEWSFSYWRDVLKSLCTRIKNKENLM